MFIVIVLIAVAICVGYFVYTGKMNKSAKYCSCGKEYSYISGDIVDYHAKKKDEFQDPLGNTQALVTVRLRCSKCNQTAEKKIRVKYSSSLQETVEDGIRKFF